jgi:mono/diheme cytochrome c family protein
MRCLPFIAAAAAALVIGGLAVGCGYEGQTTATPETVQGSVPQTTETTTTETTPAPPGDAAAGKVVFTANCGGCHTLADAGTGGTVGPNLDDKKPPAALVVDRVTNGKGVMPPFGGSLSPKQIADVAAYVSSAAGG